MRWKFLGNLLITAVIISAPFFISAATPSELKRQIEEARRVRETLVEEQNKLRIELEAINKESQSLGTVVKSLDATKKKLTADINLTQSKISSSNLTIKYLENTMGEKERQVNAHRKALANIISNLFEYDSQPLTLSLVASVKLSDIWRDRSQLEILNDQLEDEIKTLREVQRALDQEKAKKEEIRAEQLKLESQLGGQKSVVEENKKAKEKLLTQTKNRETEYQKLIADNIKRQKESETDLSRLESELAVILDPSLFPSSKHGLLSWPLDNVFLTGLFGRTTDCNIYAGNDCFHNGLDFRASMGTPVHSMLSGVVEGTGNTDNQRGCYSYGRWILIKHNNGLTSIYAHLSASLVNEGQQVETGQIIGYSGGTPGVNGSGYSTGPHLHVGLFASQGVEIRQFTTSIGCKQVFVPIAKGRASYLDPLAYLPTS